MLSTVSQRIIRLAEVKRRTGLSTSTLYALMARDEFPRQVSLGSGTAVGWVEAEIDGYIAARIAERDANWQHLGEAATRVVVKVKPESCATVTVPHKVLKDER
jgi:prophage regulatory protein